MPVITVKCVCFNCTKSNDTRFIPPTMYSRRCVRCNHDFVELYVNLIVCNNNNNTLADFKNYNCNNEKCNVPNARYCPKHGIILPAYLN